MLGIVSDKEFEKEIEKSNRMIQSIPSNHVEQSRAESADGNNSSNNSTTQREASDSFIEPRGNISSNESSEELCGKIVEINKPGRRLGDNNVPDSLRKIIGSTAVEESRKASLDLANQFGISKQSVAAYTHGTTSEATYNDPNPSLSSHIQNSRERVSKKARSKLLLALSNLSQEKIEGAKARDIASIAKDMSAVIKNMEDRAVQSVHEGPKFIFYSPTIRDERNFDIINVKE